MFFATQRAFASLALFASLVVAEPAAAKSKTEAWAAWMQRAQMIDDALSTTKDTGVSREEYDQRVSTACKGVTGTVIGQGMAFPGWGQKLIVLCRASTGGFFSGSMGKRCKELKSAGNALSKAGPVAEAPEATELAHHLGFVALSIHDKSCG